LDPVVTTDEALERFGEQMRDALEEYDEGAGNGA
jgi:hypothetical protein